MRSMLACLARKDAQQFHGIELIIAIGVLATVEAAALIHFVIHHPIETAIVKQQALAVTEVDAELFHLRLTGAAIKCWRSDAVECAVLVTTDQATFVILGHGHPGAFLLLRHGIQQLHFEAFGDLDLVRWRRMIGQLRERSCRDEK